MKCLCPSPQHSLKSRLGQIQRYCASRIKWTNLADAMLQTCDAYGIASLLVGKLHIVIGHHVADSSFV